jgi:hypothetical protein
MWALLDVEHFLACEEERQLEMVNIACNEGWSYDLYCLACPRISIKPYEKHIYKIFMQHINPMKDFEN